MVRSCIQGLRFFHQVENARQAPFAGELVYCGEEFLQAFESLLALDLDQVGPMRRSRVVPATGNQGRVRGDVLLAHQTEAGLLDQSAR